MATLEERFWSKVNKTSGCWLWTGALKNGYGAFRGPNGTTVRAHRLAWELTNEKIPNGLHVCHECDNRRCVRPGPKHLFLGTRFDNMRDMARKGRGNWVMKPETVLRGSENGNSILDELKVREIRSEYSGGAHQVNLAAKFGVTQATISQIIRGATWKHVR